MTSNVNCGELVPIPTLPVVYHTFPVVSLPHPKKTGLPFWKRLPVKLTFPAVKPVVTVIPEPIVTFPT